MKNMHYIGVPTAHFTSITDTTRSVHTTPQLPLKDLHIKIGITQTTGIQCCIYVDDILIGQRSLFAGNSPVHSATFQNWTPLPDDAICYVGQDLTIRYHVTGKPGVGEFITADATFAGQTFKESRREKGYERFPGFGFKAEKKFETKKKKSPSLCKQCDVELRYIENYGMYCPRCFDRPKVRNR